MDEAKNQTNDLEHKEAKPTNQNKKKKEYPPKTMIVYAASGTTSRGPTLAS